MQFMVKGQAVHEIAIDPDTGLHAETKQEAQNVEAKMRQRLFSGSVPAVTDATVDQFIQHIYLSWAETNHTASHFQSDRWRAKVLIEAFGSLKFSELTAQTIEQFKKAYLQQTTRRGTARSAASVNRCLQLLSKVLSLAIEYNALPAANRPRIKLLREANTQLRFLEFTEEARLRPCLQRRGDYLFDLAIVWLNTGLRKQELFRLEVGQVDFTHHVIHVLKTKSHKARQVPIFGECLEILRRRCQQSGLVFPSPKTGNAFDNVRRAFASACREAGIQGVTPHTLRHTYGTRLAASGVDVVTIKELMGHSSITTTMRYLHAVGRNKHQAAEALQEYVSRNFHT